MAFTAAQFSSTNFTFIISAEGHENIDFQCQQVSGLGITVGVTEHPNHGIPRKYPGDSMTINPLSLTILLDDKLLALKQILDHIYTIKDADTNIQDPTATFTGILEIYDSMNYPVMKFTFYDSWFESMGDVQFNSSESDNTNITVDVSMLFNYYTYEWTDPNE